MIKRTLFLLSAIVISISALGQTMQLTDKDKEALYPTKGVVSKYHTNWTKKHYRERIQEFKNEPLEFGEIVFIGNSITERGKNWAERFNIPHIRNRGIAGDIADGILARLDEIVYFKPKAVFILIGINDLSNIHHEENGRDLKRNEIIPSVAYIGRNILKISKRIHRNSPNTKIYVRTVLPSRKEYLKEDILSLNNIIKKNEGKGYYEVIDLYSQFVDEEGYLKKDYTFDGTHVNKKAYEKWVLFEKPFIEKIQTTK